MRLLHISPRSWGQLSKKTAKELLAFGLLGMLFMAEALIQPFNAERPYNEEAVEEAPQSHMTLSERLGYAILLRSGYITVELVDNGGAGKSLSVADQKPESDVYLYPKEVIHPDLDYLRDLEPLDVSGVGKIDIHALTTAILAAEKYNRSSLEKWLERWFAEFMLAYRGQLPEFSFGLAQMRPATARRLLFQELGQFELSDRDLLKLLMDNRINARLAAAYVRELCQQFGKEKSLDEVIRKVALSYNGAVSLTINGMMYSDAVRGAYDLIETTSEEEKLVNKDPKDKNTICVSFGAGSLAGSGEELERLSFDQTRTKGSQEPPRVNPAEANIHIYYWQEDFGPKALVDRLALQRKAWIFEKIVKYGYRKERISITNLASYEDLEAICGEGSYQAGIVFKQDQAIGNKSSSGESGGKKGTTLDMRQSRN